MYKTEKEIIEILDASGFDYTYTSDTNNNFLLTVGNDDDIGFTIIYFHIGDIPIFIIYTNGEMAMSLDEI